MSYITGIYDFKIFMATNTSVNIMCSLVISNKVSDRLYHEMHVSLSARDYNIHPDAHGLG